MARWSSLVLFALLALFATARGGETPGLRGAETPDSTAEQEELAQPQSEAEWDTMEAESQEEPQNVPPTEEGEGENAVGVVEPEDLTPQALWACRGVRMCRGAWFWAGGVRRCRGALWCRGR